MMTATTGDMPRISTSAYTSNTYVPGINTLGAVGMGLNEFDLDTFTTANTTAGVTRADRRLSQQFIARPTHVTEPVETEVADQKTRFVRVLIVDPNDNIPLDDRLIYSGSEKLTDSTDQELFFELDIRDLLAKHNEKRVKVIDKAVKERTQYLEAAKVRDLRMVVTTIAAF